MENINENKSLNSPEYIIEMNNITKEFPGIIANDDITLQLKKGEVHALLGENGAGKSTLMSVLFGLYEPEKGEIKLNGESIRIKDPNDATKHGIGMVHQHFMLVDIFTALENIILGCENTKFGLLEKSTAIKKLKQIQEKYGLAVDLNLKIEDMTVGQQQRVEILKMLYRDSEILIFDEPTAVLTPDEIEGLIQIIKKLQGEGKTILFISHKLKEVLQVSNRITILRKGKYVGTYNTNEMTSEKLAELMVGRNVSFSVDKKEIEVGKTILKVENLFVRNEYNKKMAVKDVSFDVKEGEIVALLGIDGNGQNELVEGLTGLTKTKSGKITLDGTDITAFNVKKRNKSGLSHIPGDRHKYGLVLDYPVMFNMILERYKEYSKFGFLKFKDIKEFSDKLIEDFDIRSSQGSVTITRSMSGGNQQKVIVAREIDRNEDLLIAVQPTRGLDIGAIEGVHKYLVKARNENKAVLLVSLELDEVFDISDRILVIYEGEIVGEFKPKDITYEEISLYMSGARRDTKASTYKEDDNVSWIKKIKTKVFNKNKGGNDNE